MAGDARTVELNGRSYQWPEQPVVVVCIDGSEPGSFDGQGHCFIAYGGTQGGMVRGEFLAEGGPRVTLQPPSTGGFRAKERFERDWRRFRI